MLFTKIKLRRGPENEQMHKGLQTEKGPVMCIPTQLRRFNIQTKCHFAVRVS